MLLFPARPRSSGPSGSESGYVLLAVIFMTFMLLLSLAIAAPKIATSLQRQKDLETVHRGEQYKRAIQLYYRKFGRYPTSIDQLVNTNNIRFLRKRYTDPLTGKDDWKLVRFGQAHVRPLGFFGQPLGSGVAGGLAGASIISSSMYAAAPAMNPDGTPATTDSGASTGGATAPSSGMGSGTGPSFGGSTSGFGSTPNPGFGSSMGSSFGSASNGGMGTSMGSSMGSPMGNTGMGNTGATATTGFGSTFSSPFGSSSMGGGEGTTFGGGGFIVGVTLPVNKPSLIDYKKQNRYNKWEFNYDPMEDQMKQVAGAGRGATNVNGTTSMPGVGNPNQGTGSSPFGGSTTPLGGTTSPMGGPSFGGVPSGGGSTGSSGNSGDSGSSGGSGDSGNSGSQPSPNPQP